MFNISPGIMHRIIHVNSDIKIKVHVYEMCLKYCGIYIGDAISVIYLLGY